MKTVLKTLAVRILRLFRSLADGLERLVWTARFREWQADNPYEDLPGGTAEREQFYDRIRSSLPDGPICYLEFGVAGGDSMRSWLAANRHPDSVFLGFDSFRGLPEDWDSVLPAGAFDRGGKPPPVDDARSDFVVGMFADTVLDQRLDSALSLPHRRIVHLDADLYASTMTGLLRVARELHAGDILIFDEFNSAAHEFRALLDACAITGLRCRPVLGLGNGRRLAFTVE